MCNAVVCYLAHNQRENCAAYNTHRNKGWCLLRMAAQVLKPQAKYGRKHNAEKEIDHQQCDKGWPAKTLRHY